MKLAEISVKNSLLVNLISLFIIAAGIVTLFHLKREAFPRVDFDRVTVTTVYPGAPAEDVEKFVTLPIEKELKGISGVKEMESASEEGLSRIGITINPEVSDKDDVVTDIRDAVDRVRDLPDGVEDEPLVKELKSRERPVIEISLSGDFSELIKRKYAESLEDLILDIPEVASVRRIGWRDREFWVEVNPKKIAEYHVSMEEIAQALRNRNVTLPGGTLETAAEEYDVRITGELTHPEEIENVVIRANDAGNWLKVRDVGRVVDTFEDQTRIAKVNGKRSVSMVVILVEHGDILRVADQIKKTVERFRLELPAGMDVTLTNDLSYFVNRRLGVLQNNGIIGFILVLCLLFLFLEPMPALVTAFGIPIALFSTFIVMDMLGISVNLVSMLGLIIVLGMLVDDGIIVAENAYRYIEEGMPPREAAIRGTQEVIAPVTVTILTTFAAFAPLLFMEDIIGKFIKEIPFVVIVALSASLFEAFIILPSHICDFVNLHRSKFAFKKNRPQEGESRRQHWFNPVKKFYLKILNKALNLRYVVLAGLVGLLAAAVIIYKVFMHTVFFTDEGMEQFFIRMEAAKGTSLNRVNELIAPVENLVAELPKEEVDAFRTFIGSIESERGFDPHARQGSHLAQITVFLTPFQQRERTPKEITDALREQFKEIEGFEKINIFTPKPGPPVGRAVSVAIKGEDFGVLQEMAKEYTGYLETIPGVSDSEITYEFGKKQLQVKIDEERARQFYLTISQIAATVRAAFKGAVATTVKPLKAEEEIHILVRFQEEERDDFQAFKDILIPNQFNKLVPLSAVADVVEEEGVYQINHVDGRRVLHVLANVDDVQITSLEVNNRLKERFKNISREYFGTSVEYSGEYEEQMESRQNLLTSFAFALFFIFIILTAMFRSLIQPFIVMLAIPFGLIGVIFAFLAHGRPLSFFALMGVVGLTGIVVNDSIVLVDFINRLRHQGKERRQSLVEAGELRLRPVIMTTVTTIGGLISVAYGIGGGDPFLKPMALAIVWGIFFATGLTLIGIPCIYAIVDDFAEKVLHRHLVAKAYR